MNFFDLLIDPETKEPLQYDKTRNELISTKRSTSFKLMEGIPVIRLADKEKMTEVELHQIHQSTFDYLDHYQKDAEVFNYFEESSDNATRQEIKRLHEAILHRIPKECKLILDVGCGNGWLAKALLPEGKKIISMDISTANPLKVLKENPNPNHFGLVANVFKLPIKEQTIDCIIASEIMEHVDSPKKFILSLLKVLKPGGILIITTPYNEKIKYNLCVHCNKPTPQNAHLHSFNENNIKSLIPSEVNYNWKKFSNKYLSRLRTHIFLSIFPFKTWNLIDKVANRLFKKEARLMIKIKK